MFELESEISYHGVLQLGLDAEFVAATSAVTKGFPWKRFEAFFAAQPINDLSVSEQVFMLRIVAVQEYLCVGDEAVLKWVERQNSASAFLNNNTPPALPTPEAYRDFCHRLQELNILHRFRERCQRLIMKYGDVGTESETVYNPVLALDSKPATWSESLLGSHWVSCPECKSYSPKQTTLLPDENEITPENRCSLCGHHFDV